MSVAELRLKPTGSSTTPPPIYSESNIFLHSTLLPLPSPPNRAIERNTILAWLCRFMGGANTCQRKIDQPRSSLTPLPSQLLTQLPETTTVLIFFSHRFILPVVELHINGTAQFGLFCARLLSHSIMSLRITHVLACISNFFLFIAK